MICLRLDQVRRFRGFATLPVLVVLVTPGDPPVTPELDLLRLVKMGGLGMRAAAVAGDIWCTY